MSDYLRSAFGYLNGGPAGSNGGDASSTTAYTATATSSSGSELVGQNLDVNGVKLRVTRLIAEAAIAESNGFDPREAANIEPIKPAQPVIPPRPGPHNAAAVPPPRPAPPGSNSSMQPPPRPGPPRPGPPQGQYGQPQQSSGSVVHTVDEALNLFATRRCQPPQIQPSEIKMIEYMAQLANHKLPHMKPLILRSLLVQPVPLFTRARDGCRPYVEIYSNGAMVFSTKRNEYEEMKLFGMNEGKVCLILGDAAVRGDISMVLYHARQQLGRVIGIKMASFHFHTGYVPLKDSTLIFEKKDLDDTPEIGGHFRIVVNAMIGEDSAKFARVPAPWEAEDATTEHIIPDPLFGSTLEMEETLENFRIEGSINNLRQSKEPTPEAAPLVRPSSSPTPPPRPPQLPRKPSLVADFPPPQVEADLLNLGGGPSSDATPAPAPTPTYIKPEFDIFAQDATPSAAAPLIDNKPAAAVNDDLLGGFGSFVQAPPPPNTPTANQTKSAADLMFGQTNGDLLFGQGKNNLGSTNASQPKDIFDPFAGSSKLGTPIHATTPRMQQAHTPVYEIPQTNVPSEKPPKSGDAFEDLLGSQGYNFFTSKKAENNGPKTMNEMRKVEAAKNMDPETLKVAEWTEGKKGNLRALLCSMHSICWDGCKWQKCEMHMLVSPADVKKAYRKACLAVHPDKRDVKERERDSSRSNGISKTLLLTSTFMIIKASLRSISYPFFSRRSTQASAPDASFKLKSSRPVSQYRASHASSKSFSEGKTNPDRSISAVIQ
ncbi:unnamed protein product [Trichogramma brassicae]|uniref:C2 tensin-type domain-containing protein n=1 Tax=Trichogramma brassicae TaxID=86971 RepID=A0A6H5IPS8_9HYME|nr:unnamed protein product [Trichogramma brassicae]